MRLTQSPACTAVNARWRRGGGGGGGSAGGGADVRVMSERCVVTHGTHSNGSDTGYHLSPEPARRDPAC